MKKQGRRQAELYEISVLRLLEHHFTSNLVDCCFFCCDLAILFRRWTSTDCHRPSRPRFHVLHSHEVRFGTKNSMARFKDDSKEPIGLWCSQLHRSIVPLFHDSMIPLFHYSIIPLFDRFIDSSIHRSVHDPTIRSILSIDHKFIDHTQSKILPSAIYW